MRRACVIGWPIEHSRSPDIHNYWLEEYALDGSYDKVAVQPSEVEQFLNSLVANGFEGCNVTIPHKETAFRVAQETEPSARAVGAANTLWLENRRLCASNTDTYGFMTYLSATVPGWKQRDAPVSILGAGGAARAIAYGFLEAGVEEVRVFNRTGGRAEALADALGPRVKAYSWDERSKRSQDVGVLVNATSLGLKGQGSPGIEFDSFDERCIVADIVYVPLVTDFLQSAKKRGLKTVDGLGMLLHQAVPGFEKWFGVRPEVTDKLYRHVAATLEPV